MGEGKDSAHLNGAYYGPPIPPSRSYHRPSRGSGCCCGPCCLLTTLLKLIISLVVLVGIIVLVLWLVLRPSRVKVYVESASLTQFNLTDNNILQYNLQLDVSVRNPNKRVGIYYDRLEARAFFKGERFDSINLPTFYQGHKNTTMIYPSFSGQQLLVIDPNSVSDFNNQKAQGSFEVDVKIYARIRFKIGKFKTNRYKPDAECELRVPLTANGSPGSGFKRTKCDIDF